MTINKPYSFNNLASVIASLEWESTIINLSGILFIFTDYDVSVIGEMIGTFDVQKQTYEQKGWEDLVDVHINISSVVVSGETREIIYNWEDKEKLIKMIKDLMI